MGTMDEFTVNDDVRTNYLRDYDDDPKQAAISFCRDVLNTEAARNNKDRRHEMIEHAREVFELNIWQLAVVQEHV